MKIKSFQVNNFKSIDKSGNINLDKNLTTFIGANESGKTSILMALNSIGTDQKYSEDELCTFSESWDKWKSNEIEEKDIKIIEVIFELSKNDKNELKAIDEKFEFSNTLKCTKFFNNQYILEFEGNYDLYDLIKNKKDFLINKDIIEIKNQLSEIKDKLLDTVKNGTPHDLEAFAKVFDDIMSIIKDSDESNNYLLDPYFGQLRNLAPDNVILNEIDTILVLTHNNVSNIKELRKNDNYITEDILNLIPKFKYFRNFDQLKDEYPTNLFIEQGDETLENLMKLSNLQDIGQIRELGSTQRGSELAGGSLRLTRLFNKYWDQDEITFDIHIDDYITVMIKDKLAQISQKISLRSQGLRDAVSLFVNIMSQQDNSIIIIDDPCVHLHASGQKNILNLLQEISKSRQIIFSTHSPFMVDRNRLDSIRITNKKELGTVIQNKAHHSDHDAFAPIRASIGMFFSDFLFNGKNTLMVEGPVDNVILSIMSQLLFKNGKNHFDASETAIFPVNGADKMIYFSTLFLNEDLKFIVILDNDRKGRDTYKKLRELFGDEINIICYNAVKDTSEDVEIEDLIDFEFYLKAVNLVYDDELNIIKISKDNVESFKDIEEYFKTNKTNIGNFDKLLVANKIREMIINNDYPQNETMATFSKLFDKINKQSP